MKEQELFDIVKNEPSEITLEQVDKMVMGFPMTPTPSFDWSSIINLNNIIMSSIAAFILAGSIMLYSGDSDGESLSSTTYQLIPQDTEQLDSTAPAIDKEETSTEEPEQNTETEAVPTSNEEEAEEPEVVEDPETPTEEPEAELALDEMPPAEEELPEPEPEVEEAPAQESQQEWELMVEEEMEMRTVSPPVEDGRKTFTVGSFDSVELSGSWEMRVEQGNEHSVWAEGDEEMLEKLELRQDGRNIKLYAKKNKSNGCYKGSGVTIHVTMPRFENMAVSGSGDMHIGRFTGLDDVSMHIAGSGSIKAMEELEIGGDSEFHIAGSGAMNVDGTARSVEVHIAGSGDFKGADLRTSRAEVHIAGSGDVQIHAEEELDVSIAGSGDVRYEGSPRINQSVAGSGDVSRLN